MAQFNVRDWVEEQSRRKWRWAQKVASRSDSRWSHIILHWDPPDTKVKGRPKTRWSDEINTYLTKISDCKHVGSDWTRLAVDELRWNVLETGFVERCNKNTSLKTD